MSKQKFATKSDNIKQQFEALRQSAPEQFAQRLNLSWSNWGFGMERLQDSAKRLSQAEIDFIELHGNHYGSDLGYKADEVLNVLGDYGIKVAGICGMFSSDNDLSSNHPVQRQRAVDYLKREIAFSAAVGGTYLLVVPGAVGRPARYDEMEFARSVQTLQLVADLFVKHQVRAVIEPIRSAEVSLVHTTADAKEYIAAVNHPGVAHINGDVYHMQTEESHIGEAVLEAGDMLINLHFADSNRGVLGGGSLDVDTIIRALYLIGYNTDGKYVTFEPLGPGGDPYPAMYGKPAPDMLDELVVESVDYFRSREEAVLAQ